MLCYTSSAADTTKGREAHKHINMVRDLSTQSKKALGLEQAGETSKGKKSINKARENNEKKETHIRVSTKKSGKEIKYDSCLFCQRSPQTGKAARDCAMSC